MWVDCRCRHVEPRTFFAERRVHALERIASVQRWTAAIVATIFVVWLLGDVLLLVFAAALFALGLRGLADRLSDATGVRPSVSLAVVVLMLVVVLGLGTWWAGPRLVSEMSQLHDQLLRQMDQLRAWLGTSPWGRGLLSQLPASVGGNADNGNLIPRISGTVAGALWSAVGLLGTTALVIAAALYFAAAPGPYVEGPLRLIPQRHRRRTHHVIGTVGHALQAWLAGQLVDMLVVGLVIGGGLALLDVPLPFILGVIAALLNFVPYIGAIGGAMPAVLVALSQGSQQALFVGILFVVVQALEGNVLSPMIQRRAVNLPPAATILSQTALGALFGLPGIILATPVAAAIFAALREVTSDAT
jgi:predicted PurR-regulated permease PerM